ncbi:MAG: hypothetical protein M3220_14390 [Chloroflexota bacterium]|nr:hypothetical protein [Chloroflexota bacterium]
MPSHRDVEEELELREDWDREQWEGEGQDAVLADVERDSLDDEDEVVVVERETVIVEDDDDLDEEKEHWDKHQWEGEGQDDVPHEREEWDEMGEGDSEYSGHGENPGGGKQWGEYYDRG